MSENVEIEFDEDTGVYISRYTALEHPVSTCGDTEQEAVENLVDAVASIIDEY